MRTPTLSTVILIVLPLSLARPQDEPEPVPGIEETTSTGYPFTQTRCVTYFDTTSRTFVPTSSYTSTSIRTVNETSIYHPIITVTPNATTTTGVITITDTSSSTTTVSQSPFTVPTPTSFRAFQALPSETASPLGVRDFLEIGGVKNLRLRQAPGNSQAGWSVNPDGGLQGISKVWPKKVHCDIRVVELATRSVTVTGSPSTVFAAQPTETTFTTTTVTSTTTITELLPRSTVYAACAANNVGKYSLPKDHGMKGEMGRWA